MIYFGLLLFTYLLGLTDFIRIDKTFRLLILCILLLTFITVGALRFETGADWDSYKVIFGEITEDNIFTHGIEPLFAIATLGIKLLFDNYLVLTFFICALALMVKFRMYYKYSPYFFASIMVYMGLQFMVYELNGIRQGIAIGICLLGIKPLLERKFLLYCLIVIIATGFHYSALIMLPFFFISQRSFKPGFIHFSIIASIVVGFVFSKIVRSYIVSITGSADNYLASKVLDYSNSEAYGNNIGLGFSAFHRLAIFYLFLYFRPRIKIRENFYKLLFNAYFLSLVFYFLFSAIDIIASRGSLYFRTFDVFMLAGFITIPTSFKGKLLVYTLILGYASYNLITLLGAPGNGLVPYKSILFG